MKRTIVIPLAPTTAQTEALFQLRAAYIAACSAAAAIAFQERCANRVQLHHLAYYVLRKRFPDLGAQMACKAIRAAAHGVRSQRASGGDWKLLKFARDASVQSSKRWNGDYLRESSLHIADLRNV